MEATLRRDVATATREVEEHIRQTTANVRRWLVSQQQSG